MIVRHFIAAACAALLVGAGAPVAAQAPASPPPLTAYAALPVMESPALSADGGRLAYIDRTDGQASVVVRDRLTGEVTANVAIGDRLVRGVFWASPNHVVLRTTVLDQTPFGYGEYQLMDVVNLDTGRAARVLNEAERRTFPMIWGSSRGTYNGQPVLYVNGVGEVARGGYAMNLYRIDLDSGRGRIQEEGVENLQGYLLRPDGTIAGREIYNSVDGRWRLEARTGSGWRELQSTRALLDPPSVLGFGRDLTTLAIAGEDADGLGVVSQIDLQGQPAAEPIVLPSRPNQIIRNTQFGIVGLGFYGEAQEYGFLEPALQARWGQIRQAFAGKQVTLTSYSDDFNQMVLFVEGAGETGAFYIFDATTGRMSLLRRARPDVPAASLADRRAVTYPAADGLAIHGYLTLPSGREARGLPLIVLPHGGPQARDEAGFDWWAEALASRGYAVLQPNFRGSEGYGNTFIEAGYGEWGRKMQTDLSDGVRWLAGQGVIDPARVCIVGASYGGYAAMAGMTLDAGVYRCGVAVAGVSDLRQMLRFEESEGARGRRNPAIRYWNRFMGGTGSGDASLDARSPAQLADRLSGPLLLIHGRNDTVVPFEQSTLMQTAARAAGKPVRLVALEGENHNLSYSATRLQMLQELVAFLETNNPAN
ncbi:alpha/beta fold hydrolase [Brevundimonas sp. FT23028]|uniref:S9 family peptidase n=1 Tax=Brevundimonas sp. FT23028 TaxID=3393748 RepID=UPI003B58A34C